MYSLQGKEAQQAFIRFIVSRCPFVVLDSFEHCDGCVAVRQIAEVFNMRPEDLNSFLVDQNIQRWRGGQYRLTPAFADSGLAQDRTIYYYSLEGKIKHRTYLVWTERGRDFIMNLIKN